MSFTDEEREKINLLKRSDDGKSHGALLITQEELSRFAGIYMPRDELKIICDIKNVTLVSPQRLEFNHYAKVIRLIKNGGAGDVILKAKDKELRA